MPNPISPLTSLLLAFVTVIVGGLGSFSGALLGGLVIGVAEAIAALMFTPSMKTALPYALLIIILIFRPRGFSVQKRFDGGPEMKRWLAGAMVFVVLTLLGAFADPYFISLMTIVLLFTFLGQSWNLMLGIGGQLSIGHALFVGLGAYSVGVLYVKCGISPWIGLFLGMIIAGSIGAALAWLSFRFEVRGISFRAADDCGRGVCEDHVQWMGIRWRNAGAVLSGTNWRDRTLNAPGWSPLLLLCRACACRAGNRGN